MTRACQIINYTYLNFNNNPASSNCFLLSLEVRVSVVVLYLCFILALKWKPSKKLIMYTYSRMFCDDKRSFHHCTMIHVLTLGNSTILICHGFALIELRIHLHLLCRGNLTWNLAKLYLGCGFYLLVFSFSLIYASLLTHIYNFLFFLLFL